MAADVVVSRFVSRLAVGLLCVELSATAAVAGGGPRNVLVVVNEASEESLEIGTYYARARGIPAKNVCRIQTTSALTCDKATYQDEIEAAVAACIAASPYGSRIDYLVLTRGIPIRASFPGGNVAVAALLQAMDTPLRGKDQEYTGPPYGFLNYPNPYVDRDEYFSHAKTFGGYQLYLPTMLSGYWTADALALVDRSLASDDNPPTSAGASFFLEDARAGAADVRNPDYPTATANLVARGFDAVQVLDSDPDVTGQLVAGHVSGGTYSGISQAEIASNTYPPGAIADALQSFGLVPQNFDPDGTPSQTPATWWVAAGATGVHGCVSEPYNVAFPSGFMLEPWVDGYNLAETLYQGIPYLYWMNLVLGDPLAAPYAIRPVVDIEAPLADELVSGNVTLRATASTGAPEGVFNLEFFVDDVRIGARPGAAASFSWNSIAVADGW